MTLNLLQCLPCLLAGLVWAVSGVHAGDWPQFLGPTRDAVYHGDDLADTWPKEGPALLWRKPVGEGFSGPAVAGGKLVLFHRQGEDETIECLDALTGEAYWKHSYRTRFKDGIRADNGPRATPTIDEGRVYTAGAEAEIHCLDLATGRKLWQVSAGPEYGVKARWHGYACSPLVEGNAVLFNLGVTNEAGIVAFDKLTGKVLWKGTQHRAGCSSPIAATLEGKRYVFFMTSRSLAALDPLTGQEFFTDSLDARHKDHLLAATPVVLSNLVFCSGAYNVGGRLLRVENGKRTAVWSSPNLATQYATAITHRGALFGIHGQWETGIDFRCVDLETGAVRWKQEGLGPATLLRAGDDLLVTTYNGTLIRVQADPKRYQEKSRAQLTPVGLRAYPALAGGLFYVRTKNQVFCFDLRRPR